VRIGGIFLNEEVMEINPRNIKDKSKITKKIHFSIFSVRWKETIIEKLFFLSALLSVATVAFIALFVFIKGTPVIFKVGILDFLFGTTWSPKAGHFGILPMITASIIGTIGAIIIGGVIGVFTAIFIAEMAPKPLVKIIKPAVDLLAGIPSVVYGFFGLMVFVPLVDKFFGNGGNSLLIVILVLSIMILPTIISISEIAIKSVPKEYKEGSLALGATHMQTIFKVILPAAKSGVMASIVLGLGRAIGEAMAVTMVAGNTPMMPDSLLSRVRTLTTNISFEMSYASGMHLEALYATGVILFVFIMILNISMSLLIRKAGKVI
jgi:phosphate transport system permease protein